MHSNMSQYEELLVELGDYATPFAKSPPYIQLLVLMTFNTCLSGGSDKVGNQVLVVYYLPPQAFIANALLEKLFGVDILAVCLSIV